MDRQQLNHNLVEWPPLKEGANAPGPMDRAGEYRTVEDVRPPERAARVPGEIVPSEQPIDVASQSKIPPQIDERELSPAERGMDDPRHIARGKGSMSSS